MKLTFVKSGAYLKAVEGDYWTTKTKRCELNQIYSLVRYAALEGGALMGVPIRVYVVSNGQRAQEWEATMEELGQFNVKHIRSGSMWHD